MTQITPNRREVKQSLHEYVAGTGRDSKQSRLGERRVVARERGRMKLMDKGHAGGILDELSSVYLCYERGLVGGKERISSGKKHFFREGWSGGEICNFVPSSNRIWGDQRTFKKTWRTGGAILHRFRARKTTRQKGVLLSARERKNATGSPGEDRGMSGGVQMGQKKKKLRKWGELIRRGESPEEKKNERGSAPNWTGGGAVHMSKGKLLQRATPQKRGGALLTDSQLQGTRGSFLKASMKPQMAGPLYSRREPIESRESKRRCAAEKNS